jgi:hypothetical protein
VQQPSSLIFVGIILGWAVYLLPQWVRRRETLGQSRGPDRHSSGLRVLDRRRRASGGPSSAPLLPDPRTVGGPSGDPLAEPVEGSVGVRRPEPLSPLSLPAESLPPLSPSAVAARRRARVLSILLASTATGWLAGTVVPALRIVGLLPTALLALDLAALVISGRHRAVLRARAERERRRRIEEARRARRAEPARPPAVEAEAEPPRATTPVTATEPTEVADAGVAAALRPERASERVSRELSEGTPSDAWTPVPVPPPTYTLKATAPRPAPARPEAPAEPASSEAPEAAEGAEAGRPGTRSAAETSQNGSADSDGEARTWQDDRSFADELDLDAVLARRRAVND